MGIHIESRPIVLFDGVCNFCDASVNFIIDRDPSGRFAFAPLQSPTANALLAGRVPAKHGLDSIVLIEGDHCHIRTNAVLHIARKLSGFWPVLWIFTIVPRPIRDEVYDWIARNRYKWFGKRDACRLPTLGIRNRFVDGDSADIPTFVEPEPAIETLRISLLVQSLNNERLRTLLLAGFLLLSVVIYLLLPLGLGKLWEGEDTVRMQRESAVPASILMISGAIYEMIAFVVIGRYRRRGEHVPTLLRSLNTLIEMLIPASAVYISSRWLGGPWSLFLPPVLLFFPFISFSILQLEFWACAFSGFVAASYYMILAWIGLGRFGWASPGMSNYLTNWPHHAAKAGLMIICGLVASVIARQLSTMFDRAARAGFDRDRVTNIFGRHVSPEVVDRLLKQPIKVEGELRYVCVMFLDIRGFATFSANRSGTEVLQYLNTLFLGMIEIVNRHHGFLNKFLGDGFMAVFGAPQSSGQDTRNALIAARELLRHVAGMNERKQIPLTRIGIGLHAGEAVTGNIGSTVRQEYTVTGSVVNVASRIESLNKDFASQLLISQPVRDGAGALIDTCEDLGEVSIRGITEKIRLFKLA